MNKKLLRVLLFVSISFTLFPWIARSFFNFDKSLAFMDLLMIKPLVAFMAGLYFCYKDTFRPWISLVIGLLFVPIMLIFYNDSASIYIAYYVFTALLGCLISKFLFNRNPNNLGRKVS